MSSLVRGIHHITLCAGRAQEDVDFFTQVLGQRLVKQAVLLDGQIPIYHLYYGNARADVGSIATTFPYSRRAGRPGSGQVSITSYAVPAGSMRFWREHFEQHQAAHTSVGERFGRPYIRVAHPAGMVFELVEDPADDRTPWTTPCIGADVATRGFFGAVLSVRELCEQEAFLVEALGFERVGADGAYHRFRIPGARHAAFLDLHHEPDRPGGSWSFGAGIAHHIALDVETDEALLRQKAIYEELGYTDTSELKDRYYFHSIYVRSPGGILVECTSNVPGGFCRDEAPEELGTRLHLPPWYEDQRDAILAELEPIVVPGGTPPFDSAQGKPMDDEPSTGIYLSRTRADFDRTKNRPS